MHHKKRTAHAKNELETP